MKIPMMKNLFCLSIISLLLIIPAFPQDITANLFAHYPINGNANDESGNLRNGSVFGALLTSDRSAVLNSAYQFDGIDDRIDLPFSPINFAQLTITAWVFRTKNSLLGINQGIVSNDVLGNRGVTLAIDQSNNMTITVHNTSIVQTQIFGSFLPLSQWVFVAMTYDGATLSLYQDGVFQGSIGSNGLLGGTSDFQIGHDQFDASTGRYFGGNIDDVRIYDRGLTAAEVEVIRLGAASGLIAYYPFNANANDESGNGQNGTVFGSILTTDRSGNLNSAYQFDGVDDYIQLPFSSDGLAQLSITAWVDRTKNGSAGFTMGILSNDVLVSDRGILLGLGDTNGLITIINNQSNLVSIVNPLVFVPTSQWVFVAMTYDGIELKLYQDGVLTGTTFTNGLLRGTTTFHIGHDRLDGNTQRYFGGKIDQVRVYNHGLTAQEVENIRLSVATAPNFMDINAALEGVDIGDADWGDYDGDGDLDIIATGRNFSGLHTGVIYRNDAGIFNNSGISIPLMFNSNHDWGDFDGDGDLDLVITGENNFSEWHTLLYENTGANLIFRDTLISNMTNGTVGWFDYDSDGDLDILFASDLTLIFENFATTFVRIDPPLPGLNFGDLDLADFNNDGLIDILWHGFENSTSWVSNLYQNNGDGTFTDVSPPFSSVSNGSVASGDYDNDGDLDIFLMGDAGTFVSEIYRNDGASFTNINPGLTGLTEGDATWGDYDNDGDLDILVSGYDGVDIITVIFRNDGFDVFSEVDEALIGTQNGSVAFGDYDNDGDLDIVLTGVDDVGDNNLAVFQNIGAPANLAPIAPSSPSVIQIGTSINFNWSKTTDDIIDANGLSSITYNLRIGTFPGGDDIMSAHVNASGGRSLAAPGNVGSQTTWTVNILDPGVYHFSVQAIDGAHQGSVFSSEVSFEIQPDLTSVLVAHYPFSGNASDASGSGFDGTLVGNTGGPILTDDFYGDPNTAYQFDGIGDRISLPINSVDTRAFSITAWIFRTKTDNNIWQGIVGNDDGIDRGIFIDVNDTNFLAAGFTNTEGDEFTIFGDLVPESEWMSVVMTYDGIELKVYQNGILTNSVSSNGLVTGILGFEIGWDIFDGSWFFGGKIDEVRLYNRALVPAEINLLNFPPETDLTVSFANVNPAALVSGREIGYLGEISNNGRDAGSSTVSIYFSTDQTFDAGDVFLDQQSINPITEKGSERFNGIATLPSVSEFGTQYILFIADALDEISESVELNNINAVPITLLPTGSEANLTWSAGSFGNAVNQNNDEVMAMARDINGNIHIVGYSHNNVLENILIQSVSSTLGSTNFTLNFTSGSANSRANDIVADQLGFIYVTGEYTGTIDFGNLVTITSNVGSKDAFVAKFTVAGIAVWARTIGGNDDDRGMVIDVDGSGNVYVAGINWFTDHVFAGLPVTNLGTADAFIAKYDNLGNELWARNIGGTDEDKGLALAVDDSGFSHLTGYSVSTTINNGSFFVSNPNPGFREIFLARLDTNGNEEWIRNTGGDGDDDIFDVGIDVSGNVFIAGSIQNNSFANYNLFGVPFTFLPQYGAGDIFLAKYTSTGVPIWSRNYGDLNFENCKALFVDPNGDVLITGVHNAANIGSIDLSNVAGSYVAKIDGSNGTTLWAGGLTDGESSEGRDILVDPGGRIYLAGIYRTSVTFPPNTVTLFSSGQTDIYIANIAPTADFIIQGTTLSKKYAFETERMGVYAEVVNKGDVFSGSYNAFAFVSDTPDLSNNILLVATIPMPGLNPGEKGIISTTFDIPPSFLPGTNYVTVSVNVDQLVNEITLDNNFEQLALEIITNTVVPSPIFEWAASGGSQNTDFGYKIAVDANGNVFVAGQLGAGEANFNGVIKNASGFSDIFLAKYDSDANLLWAEIAGSTSVNTETALGIGVDNFGNVYITGLFYETANFKGLSLTSVGGSDIFLAKYDPNGNILWTRRAGGALDDIGFGLDITNADEIFITGQFFGPADFNGLILNGDGSLNIFVAAYDINGNIIRAIETGLGGTSLARKISVDRLTGESYITGYFTATSTFGSTTLTSNGSIDIFVAKLDNTGTVQWAKSAGGNGLDYGRGIHYDENNPANLYVTGFFTGSVNFMGTILNATSSSGRDLFIAQLDGNSGNLNWVNQLQSTVRSDGEDIDTDDQGIIYVTGSVNGSTTPSTGSLISNGKRDVILLVYNLDGTLSSAKNTGGTGQDFGLDIAYNNTNLPTLYTAGYFTGTADFNGSIVSGFGGIDFFLSKSPADSEPPQLVSFDFPQYFSGGESATVTLSDNIGVETVFVDYLQITQPQSNLGTVFLSDNGSGTFSFDLSPIDQVGIEYLFTARDLSGNESQFYGKTLRRKIDNTNSFFYNGAAGGDQSQYKMFSVPFTLDQNGIRDVFERDLGEVDNSIWRIFRYQNGSTRDLVPNGSILPGNGYWILNSVGNVDISVGDGSVPNLTQTGPFEVSTFPITLSAGWNQIGNPFDFEMNWNDVLSFNNITSEVDTELWTFEGEYFPTTILSAYAGAFVFAESSVTLQIPALSGTTNKNSRTSGGNYPKRDLLNTLDSDAWKVNFIIEKGSIKNTRSGFGMSPDAKLSKDPLDRIALPRFLNFVEMNFDHPEYFADKFAMDFVPTADFHKWEFELNSTNTGEKVVLKWDNSYFGNNDRALILYDLEAKRKIDMRMQSEYSFFGELRNFEVYYGDALYISETLKPQDFVSILYPNPASNVVTFQLGLPDSQGDYEIDIKIFNSMGQIVDRIKANNYTPGFHDIQWNIRNNENYIPSGLYLYKISIEGILEHKDLTGRLIIKE